MMQKIDPKAVKPSIEAAVLALAQTLDLMAFVSVIPEDRPYEKPIDPIHVSIEFRGETKGRLHLIAPSELGRVVVENIVAENDAALCPPQKREDALREIANITCGKMLRGLGTNYLIDPPTSAPLFADYSWKNSLEDDHTAIVNAEGMQILIQLTF